MFERRILDIARLTCGVLGSSNGFTANELRELLNQNKMMLTPHVVLDLQVRQIFSVFWWLVGSCSIKCSNPRAEDGAAKEALTEIRTTLWPKLIQDYKTSDKLLKLTSVELLAMIITNLSLGQPKAGLLAEDLKQISRLITDEGALEYPHEIWLSLERVFGGGKVQGQETFTSPPLYHLGVNWTKSHVDTRMTYSTLLCLVLIEFQERQSLAGGRRRSLSLEKAREILRENAFVQVHKQGMVKLLLSCYCLEQKCFSGSPFGEPHAGYIFCTAGSLSLLDVEDCAEFQCKRKHTVEWLKNRLPTSSRSLCNGRPGKDGDVCYCFWVLASLKILGADVVFDKAGLKTGLEECGAPGVFGKAPGQPPDIFHTYFGQLAQRLIDDEEEVNIFCGVLNSMIC